MLTTPCVRVRSGPKMAQNAPFHARIGRYFLGLGGVNDSSPKKLKFWAHA